MLLYTLKEVFMKGMLFMKLVSVTLLLLKYLQA